MSEPILNSATFGDFDRIRSQRHVGGVLTVVADSSGLDESRRAALEKSIREAGMAADRVAEQRIAAVGKIQQTWV